MTSCATLQVSKYELERQLNRARSTHLVKGIEAEVCAAGAEAVRWRFRGAAEQRAGQHVGRVAEVRVVQDVEELGPEAKPDSLGDAEDALQPDIALKCAETSQHIASQISLLPRRRG
jgi:hypothetical protein